MLANVTKYKVELYLLKDSETILAVYQMFGSPNTVTS